jgi:phage portal protein BeeE
MGGDEFGQPDQKALMETLKLNDTLLKGIAKAMNASYAVNAVVKYNTLIDDGSTAKNVAELERKLQNSESGILPLDLKGEFIPMERKAQIIDEDTLKFVDEKILRNFGVPLAILTGDYTKEQYEAFYQKSLEPLIKSFSQALTKKMFTKRERAFGNRVELYPEDLIFMTTTQKIEMLNLLSPTGAVFENEKRTIFGLSPLPELAGQRYMSLNWVSADIASQYQMGKVGEVNIDIVDEEKEDI